MNLHDCSIVGTTLAVAATMWVALAEGAHNTLLSLFAVAAGIITLIFTRMREESVA